MTSMAPAAPSAAPAKPPIGAGPPAGDGVDAPVVVGAGPKVREANVTDPSDSEGACQAEPDVPFGPKPWTVGWPARPVADWDAVGADAAGVEAAGAVEPAGAAPGAGAATAGGTVAGAAP